eukprot:860277-Rhodomonas_salina.1
MIVWVKGHSGDPGNTVADKAADAGCEDEDGEVVFPGKHSPCTSTTKRRESSSALMGGQQGSRSSAGGTRASSRQPASSGTRHRQKALCPCSVRTQTGASSARARSWGDGGRGLSPSKHSGISFRC